MMISWRGKPGLAAFTAIVALSGLLNVWYGYTIGCSKPFQIFGVNVLPNWGYFYAGLGVAFDIAAAMFPNWMMTVALSKSGNKKARIAFAACCIPFWLAASGWGWLSASGATILMKAETADHGNDLIRQKRELQEKRNSLASANGWTPKIEQYKGTKIDGVNALISGKEANGLFRFSESCTKSVGDKSREFCDGYHELIFVRSLLERDAQNASKIEDLDKRIATLEAVPSVADPQVAAMASELGWSEEVTRGRIGWYVGLTLWLFANFSLAMRTWYLALTDDHEPDKKPDNVMAVASPRREIVLEPSVITEDAIREVAHGVKTAEKSCRTLACDKLEPRKISTQRAVATLKRASSKAITMDDLISETYASTPRGEYTREQLIQMCKETARRIERQNPGVKLPKEINPAASRLITHGAVRAMEPGKRPSAGDRIMRYRLHWDDESVETQTA
ncbi:MAG: hypothetical protein C5B44_01435 [Acidobacteria bacterium]|nr:MAG: hypothetical protein C5B44_01435 [Acidobacteriota bacterium]